MFGFSMIWVHLYQARVPTMEVAVKQVTPLPSIGPDCPYTLVQLNGDAHHVPLPKEGHLSIQVMGGISNTTCRRVSQLQVYQLLSSGSQIVYPVGLNGCEVPVIASSPEPMAKGVSLLGSKPFYLKVDILQLPMEGPELKALPLSSCPPSILITSSIRPPPLKAEGEVSITTEVRELLSWTTLDTSEHASGSTTPKRQEPMVLVTLLPIKLEDFLKPVDMSSQVSTLNNAEMEAASLEEIPAPSSPTTEAQGSSGNAPPPDAAHLQEEANKALGDLLNFKPSIDVCWQKLVSKFSMALLENDSETTESIKEAEVICAHSFQEAENCCSVAIREAEAQRASQAVSIQQSHHKAVQHLEEESVEEETKSQFNFLSICQTALQASPPEF